MDEATSEAPPARDFSQLRRLVAFVRPYRRYAILGGIGVLAASGLGLVFPAIMGDLVGNALDKTGSKSDIDRTALFLAGIFLARSLFMALRIFSLAALGEGVVADVRIATYRHLLTMPIRFFDENKTGEITSRLTSDIAVVQGTVSTALATAAAQIITLVGAVILIFRISGSLALSVMAFLPVAVLVARVIGVRLRDTSTQFQDQIAQANGSAEEALTAIRVVKWFTNTGPQESRYTDAVATSYGVAKSRARLRAAMIPFVTFVGFGTLAFVLWRGGRMVLDGQMDAGQLTAFLFYTLAIAGAIGTFTGLWGQLQEALGASKRIFELLDTPSETSDTGGTYVPESVEGFVKLDDVHFSYSDRDIDVLKGVTLEAEPGEVVALVGPSGAGKSTLVSLLPRFYSPTAGTITIDGTDIATWDLETLRSIMASVPQETQLFSGTIADNLRVGKSDATDDELQSACIAAHADEFIRSFPAGYDTIIGERGVKLSGGQRQRVAIARALLNDPRILILDEATSSLDSESEVVVQEALEVLMKGRTTFVIAHRLSTIRNADKLVVLHHGRIQQVGTHAELIEQGGLYADLYRLQFATQTLGEA
ncbi:Efflux ABC transporter, permease/ATP-binding protein [hydrothermal vent metagenome]|uniref:Efflux ABC transporter, permease/ATP-binding protein n=1 Tax=hydrothermal vent metagenome TaxID=652676 RepID=A0A3B0TAZ8_9ZZZZ